MDATTLAACTGATLLRAAQWLPAITSAMQRWGIDTPVRQAAFLAQIGVESGGLSRLEEGLSYSAERLCAVWPARFPSVEISKPYARNPEALANKVYGGRMGNAAPGDGFKYRGRGLKQLTGRANYAAYAAASGVDAVARPELLLTPETAADSAGWFWHANGCGALADKRDWKGLSRRINGGDNGLAERLALTAKALKALAVS